MGRGRKPDSPALKLLKGKGPRGACGPAAASPPAGMPDCPMPLAGPARAEWDRLGPILWADGRLTDATAPGFALYCDLWAGYLAASAELHSNGLVLESVTEKGVTRKANPAIGVVKGNASILIRIAAEFGLTPSSRGKVGATEAAADTLDEFLSRKAR